jgi:hypothetical protein
MALSIVIIFTVRGCLDGLNLILREKQEKRAIDI